METLALRLIPFARENEKAAKDATDIAVGQIVFVKDIHKNNPTYASSSQPEKGDYGKAFKSCAEPLGYEYVGKRNCTRAYKKTRDYTDSSFT